MKDTPEMERPIGPLEGLSVRRERKWGLIGGAIGAAFGLGSALIAVYVEGASWWSSTAPYPAFFARPRLLAYDEYLLGGLIVGGVLAVTAALAAKRSRFPRTDAFGAALGGAILTLLCGVLLFTRLVAIAGAR